MRYELPLPHSVGNGNYFLARHCDSMEQQGRSGDNIPELNYRYPAFSQYPLHNCRAKRRQQAKTEWTPKRLLVVLAEAGEATANPG